MLSGSITLALAVSAAGPSVQPALDVVARQFGARAVAALNLSIDPNLECSGDTTATLASFTSRSSASNASSFCFRLSQPTATTIAIAATSMSELTYGIGYYTRFSCGFTVGCVVRARCVQRPLLSSDSHNCCCTPPPRCIAAQLGKGRRVVHEQRRGVAVSRRRPARADDGDALSAVHIRGQCMHSLLLLCVVR